MADIGEKFDKVMEDEKLTKLIKKTKKRFDKLVEESDIDFNKDDYESWINSEHEYLKEDGFHAINMLLALLAE